jgi:hypothetical protein
MAVMPFSLDLAASWRMWKTTGVILGIYHCQLQLLADLNVLTFWCEPVKRK